MKNYIFLNTTIANIGGAELYISHKCTHLKEQGYNVYVFSIEKGNIVINNLKEYEKYVLPELKVSLNLSNPLIRRKVLNAFKKLHLEGDTIIESNSIHFSSWGEYIAKEIGAYHICYILQEINKVTNKTRDFYKFKYEQHSLFSITSQSIADMMNDGHEYPGTFLAAVGCTADTVDYETRFEIKDWRNADYTIMSLGRLNKPYISDMLNSICAFSSEHKNKMVNLIIIGGYMSDDINKQLNVIQSDTSNLKVYNLGEMNPIPHKLFAIADVAVAVAGCAHVCYRQGLPVITVDANDCKGIGLFKHTTMNNMFRKEEPVVDIQDLLTEVLIEKKYGKHEVRAALMSKQIDYSTHDALLSIPSNLDYFDVSYKADSIMSIVAKTGILLLGYERFFKCLNLIYNMKKHFKK